MHDVTQSSRNHAIQEVYCGVLVRVSTGIKSTTVTQEVSELWLKHSGIFLWSTV